MRPYTRFTYPLTLFIFATLVLLGPSVHPASAGGPLFINPNSGLPFLWPNGGQNIPYNPDLSRPLPEVRNRY